MCPGPERRIDDGFEVFEWSNSPGPTPDQSHHAYRDWLKERGGELKGDKLLDSPYIEAGRREDLHATTWTFERGLDFIKESQGQPWMLNLSIFDPHHSFKPPQSSLQRYLERFDELPLPVYEAGELENKPPYQSLDHKGAYGGSAGFAFDEMSDSDTDP